jgi:hypothetical protein
MAALAVLLLGDARGAADSVRRGLSRVAAAALGGAVAVLPVAAAGGCGDSPKAGP